MMTKKDFDKVAEIIYRLPITCRIQGAVSACDVLDSEPRFDRMKFLKMAGLAPCDKCKYVFEDHHTLAAHKSIDHKEEVENAG